MLIYFLRSIRLLKSFSFFSVFLNIFAVAPGSPCDFENQWFASFCFSGIRFGGLDAQPLESNPLICFLKSLPRLEMMPPPPTPPSLTARPVTFYSYSFFSPFLFPQSIESDTFPSGEFPILHFLISSLEKSLARQLKLLWCSGGSPTGCTRCSPSISYISNKVSLR